MPEDVIATWRWDQLKEYLAYRKIQKTPQDQLHKLAR